MTIIPKTEKNRNRKPDPRLDPGTASNFIKRLEGNVKSGDLLWFWCRVSDRAQKRTGNLADQVPVLRAAVGRHGAVVAGVTSYVGSGWDPSSLTLPAYEAKQAGARLLAISTDRFIRPPFYHSADDPDATARESDLRQLRIATEGVELLTLLDPDAPPAEVRSHCRKRGQDAKGNKGGRPRCGIIRGEQRDLLDLIVARMRRRENDRGVRGGNDGNR